MTPEAEAAKKSTLLMIPYGLYVLSAVGSDGLHAGTVNWVTQTSFQPPLIAMGVKKDSGLYAALTSSGQFALSFLESGQKDLAFTFFKPAAVGGNLISGKPFETAQTGAAILLDAPAWVEGRVVGEVSTGDHACVVGEVINAGTRKEGAQILTLAECGVKYGG